MNKRSANIWAIIPLPIIYKETLDSRGAIFVGELLRIIEDAIIWHASVDINFVIVAEKHNCNMWMVNARLKKVRVKAQGQWNKLGGKFTVGNYFFMRDQSYLFIATWDYSTFLAELQIKKDYFTVYFTHWHYIRSP